MKKPSVLVLVSVFLFLCFAFICGCGMGGGGRGPVVPPFVADIWVSTNGNDSTGDGSPDKPYRTVQKGLLEAASGQTVGLFDGAYVLTSQITWPAVEYITLRGQSRANTIIDGQGAARGFYFSGISPSPTALTIEAMTVSNCYAETDGAGMYFELDMKIHINNVAFSGNTVGDGTGSVRGGGLCIREGTVIASNCAFMENSSTNSFAGAIYVTNTGQLYAYNCDFENNHAHVTGGAIYYNSSNPMTIEACVFESNTANPAGAVFANGAASFSRCLFRNNNSDGVGGAMFVSNGVKIDNCVFYRNKAASSGGAIFHFEGKLDLINCTIATNEGSVGGGYFGVDKLYRQADIKNCIFWENIGTSGGPDVYESVSGTTNVSYTCMSHWETGNPITAGPGTTEANPNFVSFPDPINLRLTSLTTTEITEGGTSGTGIPAYDYENNERNAPYSMGAYEYY